MTTETSSASSGAKSGRAAAPEPGWEESRAVAEASRETEWTRPSFAKALYLGDFQWDIIYPPPVPSAEATEEGEEFLRRVLQLAHTMDGGRIEAEDRIPDEYLRSLAALGVFGMKIPKEYGGLGLPLAYYGRALMLLGSVHPSLGALLSAHQSIGVPEPVKLFGSEAQKQAFLPRCAAGAVTAFLLTEPDVGS
ncbi:MAG: acyl-CoA dehydrogenase, partial [Sinomonas sp.]|nr:acyl-CoA dehydrogenase [Sinomonas sp.]